MSAHIASSSFRCIRLMLVVAVVYRREKISLLAINEAKKKTIHGIFFF